MFALIKSVLALKKKLFIVDRHIGKSKEQNVCFLPLNSSQDLKLCSVRLKPFSSFDSVTKLCCSDKNIFHVAVLECTYHLGAQSFLAGRNERQEGTKSS